MEVISEVGLEMLETRIADVIIAPGPKFAGFGISGRIADNYLCVSIMVPNLVEERKELSCRC